MPADDFQMLETELQNWQTPPRFWWREDDIRLNSPQFHLFVAWSERIDAPALLGVIPGRLEPGVSDLLITHPNLRLGQHGWMHRNHEPPGEPKCEFGRSRDSRAVLDDLRSGYECMKDLFGTSFLPVFVPPWNRFGLLDSGVLARVGFHGVSRKGQWRSIHSGLERVDVHVDLVVYPKGEHPSVRSPQRLQAKLVKILSKMRQEHHSPDNPIGILTHHGTIFDDRGWALLADLVDVTRRHGCKWTDPTELFQVGPSPPAEELK